MFQANDNCVYISLNGGQDWSDAVTLPRLGVSKTPFDIHDPEGHHCYQFAYSIQPLPGVFRLSHLLTVMAGYTIVNATPEQVQLLQLAKDQQSYGPEALTSVDSMCSRSWHKVEYSGDSIVQVRTLTTEWSRGTVDLNEVGTTVLVLPRRDSTNTTAGDSGGLVVVHVEVKLSEPTEYSYVTVVIWCGDGEGTHRGEGGVVAAALSLQNLTDSPLTVLQAGIQFDHDNSNRFELCIPPGAWRSFGWVDPAAGTTLK
jgi:hypothetical protein